MFISSTRMDLADERRALTDALLKNQFIPVGMEQFGARTDGAWPIIKRFIDECDFYVLVIAGLYGSLRQETGFSYTESEYEYATQAKKPVLAFVHEDISALPAAKVERNAAKRKKLAAFTARVEADLVRATWRDTGDLVVEVTSALNQAMQDNSAVGWIRGDAVPEQFGLLNDDLIKPCTRLGIQQVSVDGVAGPAMPENLARARTIRIMSTSAVRLLEIYREPLAAALRAGGHIRALLPDPQGAFIADVEEAESLYTPRGANISDEITIVRHRLLDVLGYARSSPTSLPQDSVGTVEIGYFTTHLRSTLVLCDDRWGWLTLTLPPARAPETASLVLNGGERSLLNTCVRHFDRTWEVTAARNSTEQLSP
ncbi:DUF4062 domain-containing protein [Streptomyces sp. AC555_RSS877]|uniref:DUF4062 domain-containing protein n=1 Tax=Streptomyces sp. AC555_RSS877 TaxID=2823688 RepID=UPI001C269C83|nr:DUF4062 domain-containing protein [Streptomyces sp. AC555_RSS877]